MAVVRGVTNTHAFPVRQQEPPRPLHLKEKDFNGILRPGDFQPLPAESQPTVNLFARKVGPATVAPASRDLPSPPPQLFLPNPGTPIKREQETPRFHERGLKRMFIIGAKDHSPLPIRPDRRIHRILPPKDIVDVLAPGPQQIPKRLQGLRHFLGRIRIPSQNKGSVPRQRPIKSNAFLGRLQYPLPIPIVNKIRNCGSLHPNQRPPLACHVRTHNTPRPPRQRPPTARK